MSLIHDMNYTVNLLKAFGVKITMSVAIVEFRSLYLSSSVSLKQGKVFLVIDSCLCVL